MTPPSLAWIFIDTGGQLTERSDVAQLTVAKVLVHSSVRVDLGTLDTLSDECLVVSFVLQAFPPGSAVTHSLESLIGDLLDFDVHRSLLPLSHQLCPFWSSVAETTHRHDDQDQLRILFGLHESRSCSISQTSSDALKVEAGIVSDDIGELLSDWTSTLDEDLY